MNLKRFLSCLLTVILVCSTVLTGCGKDGSMFSDMKDTARIEVCEFSTQGSITLNSNEEDPTDIRFTADGKTDGKSAAVNMSITQGAVTYTLDDFLRMTDNTLYINLSSILASVSSLFGGSDLLSGIKNWVSIPVSEINEDTRKLYLDFYDAIIDSFEKACKDQEISQSGDVWTLNVSGDKLVSFIQSALEEMNTNFSSWYDLYVDLLEKSGGSELLDDYSSLSEFGFSKDEDESDDSDGSSDDNSQDPIQALKDNKEDAVKAWNEAYSAWKEQLAAMEKAINNGTIHTSITYSVSLTGKEGSRNGEQAFEFQFENTQPSDFSDSDSILSSDSLSITMNQTIKEISEVTVEAPSSDDVMTFEELSYILESFMNLNSFWGGLGYDEDESLYEDSLSEEEAAAITASLKDNQAYLYHSDSDSTKPYVLTFDKTLYEIDSNIGDYTMDLWVRNAEASYASVAYEDGTLSEDLLYYLEDGQKTSSMTTDIGDVLYYTADEADEWDCYTTTFGIQLDEQHYFIGILELEKDADLDAETYLKGLLKELKPYETDSSSSL